MNPLIIKERKLRKVLSGLSIEKLRLLSEDNPDMTQLNKEDYKILGECVSISSGKEEISEKEFKKNIGEIIVFCTLEFFRRQKLMFINQKGYYEKTKMGKKVYALSQEKGK